MGDRLVTQCEVASREEVALSERSRGLLHGECPGAYREPDGSVHRCGCSCHVGADVDFSAVLPVLAPSGPMGRGQVDKAEKGPKRAPKGTTTPGGRCEHCGAPCRGRFLPGHDAKLKSELAKAAAGCDGEAWAELLLRGWAHLVRADRVSETTRQEGEWAAKGEGFALVERRNRERTEVGPSL